MRRRGEGTAAGPRRTLGPGPGARSRRRSLLALRSVEGCFSAIFAYALFFGPAREWAAPFALAPAFVLLCLYYDGQAARIAATVFVLLCSVAWLALGTERVLPLNDSLFIILALACALGLLAFIGDDLRYALVDRDEVIAETDHRLRNVLQTVLGLSSLDSCIGAVGSRELLRIRLMALRHVQDGVDASPDLTRLDLSGPLRKIAYDIERIPGPSPRISTSSSGLVAVEHAGPIALIVTDLLVQARWAAPGCGAISVDVSIAGGLGRIAAAASDTAGRGMPIEPHRMQLAGLLLGQLHAEAGEGPVEGAWSAVFDSRAEARVIRSDNGFGRSGSRRRARSGRWRPILGAGNRGKPLTVLRKANALADTLVFLMVALAALAGVAALTDGGLKYFNLAGIAAFALSLAVLRTGRLRAAIMIAAISDAVLLSASYLMGPSAPGGVNFYALFIVFPLCLHFLGPAWGLLGSGVCATVPLAWFFLLPGRLLPPSAFAMEMAGMGLFLALGAIVARACGRDVKAKETLVDELRRRTRESLDILVDIVAAPAVDEASFPKRLRDCVQSMSLVQNVVAGQADPAAIPMAQAIDKVMRNRRGAGWTRLEGSKVAAEGALAAEKAFPALLLVAELYDDAGKPGPGASPAPGPAPPLEFREKNGAAELTLTIRTEAKPSDSAAQAAIMLAIESQLSARRAAGSTGGYSISFTA